MFDSVQKREVGILNTTVKTFLILLREITHLMLYIILWSGSVQTLVQQRRKSN